MGAPVLDRSAGDSSAEVVEVGPARQAFVESRAETEETKGCTGDAVVCEFIDGLTSADLKGVCPPDCLSMLVKGEAAGNLVPSPREAPVIPALGLIEEAEVSKDLAGDWPVNGATVLVVFGEG